MNIKDNYYLYNTWEENYNKALELYNSSNPLINDEYIILLINTAHQNGLNVHKNRFAFLNSSLILAKLYFKYKNYKLAENNLLMLRDSKDDNFEYPNWINFYSAITYYKIQLSSIISNSEYFLKEVSSLLVTNKEEEQQRVSIILDFFNNLNDYQSQNSDYDFDFLNQRIAEWKETINFNQMLDDYYKNQETQTSVEDNVEEDLNEIITNLKEIINRITEENTSLKSRLEEILRTKELHISVTNPIIQEFKSIIKPRQLLIITDKTLSREIILGICKNNGFDKKNVRVEDNYGQLPFSFEKIRYSSPYDGIIFGAVPHSMPGKGTYSSLIEMLKNEEGYPHVEESKTISGELKLTKESLKSSLKRLNTYLDAIN
jgi:hypothetical protein